MDQSQAEASSCQGCGQAEHRSIAASLDEVGLLQMPARLGRQTIHSHDIFNLEFYYIFENIFAMTMPLLM